MNEILRAKRLTEEILARAAAIKSHMEDSNARMENMQRIEDQAKHKKSPEPDMTTPQLQLLDLPDDLLGSIAKSLRSYDAMLALSWVSHECG